MTDATDANVRSLPDDGGHADDADANAWRAYPWQPSNSSNAGNVANEYLVLASVWYPLCLHSQDVELHRSKAR